MSRKPSLAELFWTFFKIGWTAFGGFMALVAVVEKIIVDKKKWLESEKLLEGISLGSIMPGPLAVNVVSYTGYSIRGFSGAIVAAFAVTLPSFILMIFLSWIYFTYGNQAWLKEAFSGVLPAVVAVVVAVAWKQARKNLRLPIDYLFAIVALILLSFIGGFLLTLGIVAFSAFMGAVVLKEYYKRTDTLSISAPTENTGSMRPFLISIVALGLLITGLHFLPISSSSILSSYRDLMVRFSTMSVSLFGGGYVMIPMMQEVVVDSMNWLTELEFSDGIALGQVTPGPVLISAAFIGYKKFGIVGAAIATLGIFAPSGLLMILASAILDRLRSSELVQAAMRCIRTSVVGLIFAAAVILAKSCEPTWLSVVIFLVALIALIRFKANVLFVIPAAGLIGLLLYLVR